MPKVKSKFFDGDIAPFIFLDLGENTSYLTFGLSNNSFFNSDELDLILFLPFLFYLLLIFYFLLIYASVVFVVV
jgi:hypothetical protein